MDFILPKWVWSKILCITRAQSFVCIKMPLNNSTMYIIDGFSRISAKCQANKGFLTLLHTYVYIPGCAKWLSASDILISQFAFAMWCNLNKCVSLTLKLHFSFDFKWFSYPIWFNMALFYVLFACLFTVSRNMPLYLEMVNKREQNNNQLSPI